MNNGKRDQRFDDGALVRSDFRDSGRQISDRKTAQLCAQVRWALVLALLGEVQDEVLWDLEVSTVEPTADPSCLRVVFLAKIEDDGGDRLNEIQARLEAARGLLTAEVAQAIHRRRVPGLVFAVQAAPA